MEAKWREAAQLLWTHWQGGQRIEALPPACRPATRREGYAIQAQVEAVSGRTPFGWKIAATSTAGQAHIGVDGPLAGRLLNGQVHESGALLSLQDNQMRVAEPEFAFRMGRDLPPRNGDYTQEEVLAAVSGLHPAIEVPDSRYADFVRVGAPQLIADNACAHQFVLGAATGADWRGVDLGAHAVQGTVAGRYQRPGKGANVLGDPRIALTWIANELSGLGITLRAGETVTTGTCIPPLEVLPGDHAVADFGIFGRVEVRFSR
jgi:2-keto-4-pentenoate hydratase